MGFIWLRSVVIHIFDLSLELGHGFLAVFVGQLVENFVTGLFDAVDVVVVLVAADSFGEHHVALLDGLPLGMDRAERGVLQQAHQVRLGGLLQRHHRLFLEAELVVDSAANVSHESHEWGSRNEHVRALLVSFDLSECDGAGLEFHFLLFALRHGILGALGCGFRHLALVRHGFLFGGRHHFGWHFLRSGFGFWHFDI